MYMIKILLSLLGKVEVEEFEKVSINEVVLRVCFGIYKIEIYCGCISS